MAGIQMFNLGPPAVDTYSMLSNLGQSFFNAYDAQRKRAAEDRALKIQEEGDKINADYVKSLTGTPSPADTPAQPSKTIAEVGKLPTFAQGNDLPYASAIKSIESGGKYAIVGPTHPKMGRALGAYQVMEANLPQWSMEALGRRVTPDEFLANPAIQDQIFNFKFGQYVQKYGNPQDAASVWFSGRPLAGNNSKDVLGTSVPAYVSKFNAALQRSGAPGGQRTQVASIGPGPGFTPDTPSPVSAYAPASANPGFSPMFPGMQQVTSGLGEQYRNTPPAVPQPQGATSFDEAVPGATSMASLGGFNGTPTMPLPSFVNNGPTLTAPPQAAPAAPQAPAPVQVAQAVPAAPVASDARSSGDPIADAFRRLPPAQQAWFARALSNRTTAPAAMARLQAMVKQNEYTLTTAPDGSLVRMNKATGIPERIPGFDKPEEYQRFKAEDGSEYAWNPKNPKAPPFLISKSNGFVDLVTPDQRNAAGVQPDYKGPVQRGPDGKLVFPAKAQSEVTTNINPGENEQKKVIGKFYGERFTEIQKAGNSSLGIKNTLRLMENATNDPNFYSGMGGEKVTAFKQGLAAVGINPNAAAPNELFRSLANDVVLGKLGGSLGAGVSNADTAFLQQTAPGLANTIPGNRAIISVARKLADRQQVIAKMAREYAAKNGGQIDAGFDDMLSQWAEANPLFGEKDMAEINAAMKGPPVPQVETANTKGAIRIPQGMSPDEIRKRYPKGTKIILPDGEPGEVR